MGRQRHSAEQIIGKVPEVEVLQGKRMPIEEILRKRVEIGKVDENQPSPKQKIPTSFHQSGSSVVNVAGVGFEPTTFGL
jgi:hypothetical protein